MGVGGTSSSPAPMRAPRWTTGKISSAARVPVRRAPCAGGCSVLRARNGEPGRAWRPLVGRDHVGGVLGVPAVARTEAGRVTAARLPVPSTPPPTTTAGQLPAPTGPSRHADPGPPRRTAGNSGQITTIAVHPAVARPALPSPQGLSTPRPAATRPPPERASGGGHRASVCVALVSSARTVPTQNSLKTLDAAVPKPVSVSPVRLTPSHLFPGR